MALKTVYDFRILLETVNGNKISYITSSFIDTSTELVLSASQAYGRITSSVSCSYVNTQFTSSVPEGEFTVISGSGNLFTDSKLLSSSLTGSLNTGSIVFTALDSEYDRLLRYKFIGEKVCTSLGLPSDQWVYVDQVRLPVDDERNYFQGDVNAEAVYVGTSLQISNAANINSNIPILINTQSSDSTDRYIKFTEIDGVPMNTLMMGYNASSSIYELTASSDRTFNIHGVNRIQATTMSGSDASGFHLSRICNRLDIEVNGSPELRLVKTDDNPTENYGQIIYNRKLTLRNVFDSGDGSGANGDIELRTVNMDDAIYIQDSTERVGIGTNSPAATLHVAGGLKIDGAAEFIGAVTSSIVSSSILFSSGSNIFGDDSEDTHTFTGNITASGNISASGIISASEFGPISSSGTGIFNKLEIRGVDGTLAADYIIHKDDDNTKFGFPANDKFKVRTNGVDRFNIIADGKIGIGNDAPTKQLQVTGDISASGELILGDLGNGSYISASNGNIEISGSEGLLQVEGNISASGDISASGKIHSRDEFILKDGSVSGDTLVRIYASNDDGVLDVMQNGTTVHRLDASLVGTTFLNSPVALGTSTAATNMELTVNGDISASGDLYLQDTTGIPALSIGPSSRLVISSSNDITLDSGDDFFFKKGGTSIATMFDDGGLRLGSSLVSTPSSTRLEVAGIISSSGELYANNQLVVSSSGAVMTGYNGNQTQIKLLPRDFLIDDDNGRSIFVEEDTAGDLSFRSHAAGTLFASVEIPVGFKATAAMIYGSDTSNAVEVYEGYLDDPDFTDKTPGGGCVVGTECNMTDVSSTPLNFLWVSVTVANSSDLIYGGYVNIEQI